MTARGVQYVSKLTVARLATVDADGTPHCVPVCYAHEDGHFFVMTSPTSKKARNVIDTGRAAITVDDGQKARGVMARGAARVIEDGDDFHAAQKAMLDAGALSRPRDPGEEIIIDVTAEQWVEWGLAAD